MERKYKETYEKRANDAFEEKCDKSRYFRIPFFLRYCLPMMQNVRVLDLGAADGIVIEDLKENGVGCDIAFQYCLRMASKGIQSVCCAAEYLPFKKGAFDLIIASAILEHVIDLRKCVKELIGLFKEGDLLLVNVPYMEDLTPYLHYKYEFSHMRSFDEEFLVSSFGELNVVRVYYHDFSFIFVNIRSSLLNRILGILYAAIPKRLRCFLLKTKWTVWMKPFSISIIFQKKVSL
jgi:ubiquinone/menaquinone biosynthesis C-methylase UbiE